ncbi:PAS domain-containing sensor histidine kinase [Hymenobacter algoricola]|uniref:histidine kinase n=1 Tax=Hymenobacter algoricola TaxID=486267 RepID=A0ABP7NAN7_9BACT
MSTPAAPLSPDLAQTLLSISLTGVILFRPVYEGTEITDLAYEQLNPAAQRMLQLPEQPAATFLTLYPHAREAGIFAFYRDAFRSGEPGRFDVNYQHDGLDNFFHLAAQRSGALLVVSFTDTADHDRPAVELALRESQTRQRDACYQIFEHTPAAMCIQRGPEHRYEYCNATYQALFPGRPLLGLTAAEALPETVDAGFVALLDEVYRTGTTYFGHEQPLLLAQPAGRPPQEQFFTFTYQAYRENGGIVGISTFAFDVTEQVEARQEADRQRQLLHTLFMQAPVPIVILDGPELVYQLVNPAYQQIFPGRKLLGRPLLQALPELAGTLVPALLREVYLTGATRVVQELPLLLARYEGAPPEEIYWNFTVQARYDTRGLIDGILGFAQDVTEQVRARQLVELSEQNFRQMADSVPAMIWVTDPDGYCTYLNEQWYAFTGQSEQEALGLGWVNALHPDDAASASQSFLDANARQLPFHCLYRLRRRDGVYRWATDSGLPRFAPDGSFAGIVGTVIDIHEQKLAEQALQRLTRKLRNARDDAQGLNAELQTTNQQLTRSNVDLDNFIYTASHDLKAPITNIEGLLHVLQHELAAAGPEPAAVSPVLGMMHESVARFQRTINQLSDVTKLQKEHGQPTTDVALQPVLDDVQQDLLPLLRETGAQLDLDVADCPNVLFSAKNLRSVLFNLLSNALKYRHPDRTPHVRIRCRQEPGRAVLSVEDNGLGLEPDQLPQLFAMFRRLHSHVEGSGLGLYMVQRSVENAGGKVLVTSQPGVGSTFTVYFPR